MKKFYYCFLAAFILFLFGCSSMEKSSQGQRQNESLAGYSDSFEDSKSYKKRDMLDKPVQTMDTGKSKSEARMVIYNSEYNINVENIKNSIAQIEKLAGSFNGFVETFETSDSYRNARIILRIPVEQFDKSLSEIEKIGKVTSKTISAEDVTEKYTDMKLHEESLKHIRERLYSLLKRAVKPEEKVKILKEISRITSEIEVLNANLEYYKNKAAFSTVIINLTAFMKQNTVNYIPSPFEWIRSLNVNYASAKPGGYFFNKLKYKSPEGYFEQEKSFRRGKAEFIFITPGFTSGIRAGYVDNYPSADDQFWKEALLIDASNRFYKLIENKTEGEKNRYTVLAFRLPDSSVYAISYKTSGKKIIVSEAYFSTEEKYNELKENYFQFLNNLEF
ncbi:MAG: DUF4349 domain-containing protein [Spirochaetes bacterium]|nr:DUF4349 domain-containing protein [Spirochaetota bacterium]